MTLEVQPLFDTHAHIISDDPSAYPPSEEGQKQTVTPFTAEQLVEGTNQNNVPKACIVQRFHYYRSDNSYVLDSCAANPDRFTPVIMFDGQDPDSPGKLERLAKDQPVGGVRFGSPAIANLDTSWLNSPGVMRIWEKAAELAIPVTLIMFEPHSSYNIPALKMIADTFPDLPIILDHLGTLIGATPGGWAHRDQPGHTPYITGPDYGITPALRTLIDSPNMSFKFSGINLGCMEADSVDPAAFLRMFVDQFGGDRIVCGTDIGQTAGPYSRIVTELHKATALLSDHERSLVMYDNANKIYTQLPG